MQQIEQAGGTKGSLWTGRGFSALVVLFFTPDGVMKLFKPEPVIKATVGLGFPESEIVGIGITALICTALYLIGANRDVSDPAGSEPLARRSIRGVARRASGGWICSLTLRPVVLG